MSEKNKSERFSKFVSSIKRRNTKKKIPDRTNGDQYYYIHEFEQADDKMCILYDKRNDEIYQKNLKLYNDINKKLANTPFNIDNKPEPPKRPSNYERLHLWKKKNVKISAHHQSLSILYLLSNNINIKIDDFSNGVEPFEAITIAEKLSIDKNENMANIVKSFLSNINLENDIFNKYKKNNNIYNIEYPVNRIESNLSASELNLNQPTINSHPPYSNSIDNLNNKMNHYNKNNFYPEILSDTDKNLCFSSTPPSIPPPPPPPPSAPPPSPPLQIDSLASSYLPTLECNLDKTPPLYRTNPNSFN